MSSTGQYATWNVLSVYHEVVLTWMVLKVSFYNVNTMIGEHHE